MAERKTRGAVATSQGNSTKSKKFTQEDRVLAHLREYGQITSLTAFEMYRITRLAAVIFRLRKMGHVIAVDRKKTPRGEHYAVYSLMEMEETA